MFDLSPASERIMDGLRKPTWNAEYVCPICHDRGYIGHIWELCSCQTGRDLRRELDAQERAQEPPPEGQMALTWENAGTVDVREASDD